MSGHNKWSTIKRKKGALDAKRSKIFSRIAKEITIAIKSGGSADPEFNARLRVAIQNAKGANMPKDNIERAINKGGDSSALFESTFEGYAPHGIAVFVECMTDNNNRVVSNVRSIFNKYNGSLGTNGSLSFLFERKGVFTILNNGKIDSDELELELIDGGAQDIEIDEETITVYCALEDFGNLNKKLEQLKVDIESAELQRIPNDTKTLDVDTAKKVMKLIDALEDDDDVQNVYHNLEITEELANALDE
ncbi:MAG: YebC/PmpR family DNA-binding transcriptional regulator [Bacteroidales bacterium]|nr:YebC/PmpR family DNA-binding transcriptional regulator [Bacteroidales bacterium]HOY38349.1 YebC/PmpR family DNA-binding transcriptional regulator [Bacteroidales bacterium]HQP03444.1 YebC/PmpR family DNA-binding transcriptional regulator [Bacteroidales bacterium]